MPSSGPDNRCLPDTSLHHVGPCSFDTGQNLTATSPATSVTLLLLLLMSLMSLYSCFYYCIFCHATLASTHATPATTTVSYVIILLLLLIYLMSRYSCVLCHTSPSTCPPPGLLHHPIPGCLQLIAVSLLQVQHLLLARDCPLGVRRIGPSSSK